jgi:hypothetical protein
MQKSIASFIQWSNVYHHLKILQNLPFHCSFANRFFPFLLSDRLVQQIIDAVLVLNIDDPPCAVAAGALFFVLASDVSTSLSQSACVNTAFYFIAYLILLVCQSH